MLDLASIIVAKRYFPESWTILKTIIIVQVIYTIACGVGFILGLRTWIKINEPFRDKAINILKELDE